MKFLVTCLHDHGHRTLATHKEFESLPEAIRYGGTVDEIRRAEVTTVIDSICAAEAVFEELVKHSTAIRGGREASLARINSLKHIRGTETSTIFFVDSANIAVAFLTVDCVLFDKELDRMIEEALT